ncbi:MAG: hypothetical protein LBV80_08075 [Deltaproteobacteria bacterium]|jgi:hypothetical protein|nr:hypothetical protein [Deltaproteobacteria bacterium]
MDFKSFIIAVRRTVYGSDIPAKDIADCLGHSEQYLDRICKPNPDPEEKRHLSVESWLKIMFKTQDFSSHTVLTSLCGRRTEPIKTEPDKDLPGERLDDYGALGKANILIEEKAHPNLVDAAINEVVTELQQTAIRYRRDFNEGKRT